MLDDVIIGGGVIGLSLACELAGRKRRVAVVDRGLPGRAASWAGAGMLPPASPTSADPVEQFCHAANQLHALCAESLRKETGIDTGYRACGAIYLAGDLQAATELIASAERANRIGIQFETLNPEQLQNLEPNLSPGYSPAAYLVPGESHLRNPWYLRALEAACRLRGVEILPNVAVRNFDIRGQTIESIETSEGTIRARQFCLSTGAWTGELSEHLGFKIRVRPIRGQIALLKLDEVPFQRIINEGPRYLVPREGGRVLVGSTMEEVGFDVSTTREGIDGLLRFARTLVPKLAEATLENSWAGLRPASADALPYLGRIPPFENCFVAAGHTRSGLHLSTATAVSMAQLMSGEEPRLDLTPFRVDR